SANGKTLTVSSVGMNATAQNGGIEYANGPQARTIFSFQIDGLNQSIAFSPLANKTFGAAPFSVSATASSGLPVSFAASGNCTVAGASVTLTGAGSCTITASQAGDSNFSPALDVSQTFSIAKAPVTATAGSGLAIYDGFTKTPPACTVTGAYVGSLGCVNSPVSVGPTPGTTQISPIVSGDTLSNFDVTPVNGSFTIGSLKVSTDGIRTELNDALATATNRRDITRLKDAISSLEQAVSPGRWTADGGQLVCNGGSKVFGSDQDAILQLMAMIRDTTPGIPDATIQRWINILVAIDRNLAQTAITAASSSGVSAKKIADALDELANGDADAARGDYDKAIGHYQTAWNRVTSCN
ncbi:MAG TPA: hypothetical protein VFH91_01100, partial [Pyrinomonadaceae bacterium]|nr:hypothetical protein [Pyrinomonadaceae bacterium]